MPASDSHPKVLVVEDEALLLYSISDDLRDAGFEVLEASDAGEAIRLLDANPEIRLLFTDIDMPGQMDGLKLSAVVRDRWPPVRIIITSGKQAPAEGNIPQDGLFLPKPYTPASVVAAMSAMLG
jgi:two-component system, response regulator PdtaR